MKISRKIIALLLVFSLLSLVGCSTQGNSGSTTAKDIPSGNKTDEVTSSHKSPFDTPIDYSKEYYSVGNNMFAKLEITKVYDETYFLVSDSEFENPYLLLEVTVLEDFYKYTDTNTTFTVMLALESAEDESFQKAKDVFTQADALYAYCSLTGGENYLNVEMVAQSSDEKIKLGVFANGIRTDHLRLIPCADGCVRFGSLLHEENEYAPHLKDFVYEGQSCEELEANIKNLYEKLK